MVPLTGRRQAIFHSGSGLRTLLTRRRGQEEWVLAGGSVKEGEAPWEAETREVREETGVVLVVVVDFGCVSTTSAFR
jgi:8-oxo-dGTP pyrophosphatase MutT (NUDIX family)